MTASVPSWKSTTCWWCPAWCTPTATATASPTSSWRPFPAACPWWPPMSAACGEVIRNGETGYLIPQRDPAALADAIRRMLSDREAALRMARTGRELVFRMFDTETNIAALQDLSLPTVHAVAHHPRPQRLERDHRGRGPSASTEVGPSPALFSGALSESCPAVVSRGAPSGSAPCRERKQSPFPRSATVFRRSPSPTPATGGRRPEPPVRPVDMPCAE